MEKKEMFVISVMVFLGLLSAALGFTCEVLRIKKTQLNTPNRYDCKYPRDPDLGLGLTAALALSLSQILLTVWTGGSLCCKRTIYDESNSTANSALLYFIFSWFTCILALILFISGATLYETSTDPDANNYYCYLMNPGVFTGASLMSLITVIVSLLCIRRLNSVKVTDNEPWIGGRRTPNQVRNIEMGQPQIPTIIQDPVFVHEDTYIRRQLAQ